MPIFEAVVGYSTIGIPRERIISAQAENATSGYLETVCLFPTELSISYIDYRPESQPENIRVRIVYF